MVHDLTDTQLQKLDAIHTKAIKSWLKVQASATNAILYNTVGLNYKTISDLYLEAHTLAYSRSALKADDKVKHALQAKLDRESQWTRKMKRWGLGKCHSIHQQAMNATTDTGWSSVRKQIKHQVTNMRHETWSEHQKNLQQQGHMLQLIEEEKCDLTWKSVMYDLPKGILSFAVRASIDALPTFCNLATWGKRTNDKCKLCGNRETLHHVLNNCGVSLQQGR